MDPELAIAQCSRVLGPEAPREAPAPFRVEPQAAPGLDDAERQLVEGLRELIQAELKGWTSEAARAEADAHGDDFTLLRFVQARPAGLDQAVSMYREAMAWRAERQVNLVFAELHPLATATPRHALARTIFYGGYSGVARDGSPVFVERLGKADLAGVNREGEPVLELVMLAYIQYLESCFRTVRHVSAQRGALTKVLIVVDAGGVSLSTVRHISVIKAIAKIGPANYPETTRKVYIVNAPAVFAAAWAGVSPLLPPHTRRKIQILGRDFLPAVLEQVDASQLPGFLGGTADGRAVPAADKVPEGAAEVASQSELFASESFEPGL